MNFINLPPEWQNEGKEPSQSMKENGFIPGYKPPASILNWFLSRVSKCLKELQEAIGNKSHVDVMYRNEDKNEPNTIYFVIDEDASDNINAVSYNNVIFAENTPETTAAENWFETEGGEAGAADATKIVMQNGILKVLKTPDENTDFLNE